MKARHRAIEEQVAAVHGKLVEHVLGGGDLALVKAPPGSGKTYLLLEAAKKALKKRMRVAVATQTNTQADDICRRLHADGVPSIRFAETGRPMVDLGSSVTWETKAGKLPDSPCIVVGPSAKWGLVGGLLPFDVVFVEARGSHPFGRGGPREVGIAHLAGAGEIVDVLHADAELGRDIAVADDVDLLRGHALTSWVTDQADQHGLYPSNIG